MRVRSVADEKSRTESAVSRASRFPAWIRWGLIGSGAILVTSSALWWFLFSSPQQPILDELLVALQHDDVASLREWKEQLASSSPAGSLKQVLALVEIALALQEHQDEEPSELPDENIENWLQVAVQAASSLTIEELPAAYQPIAHRLLADVWWESGQRSRAAVHLQACLADFSPRQPAQVRALVRWCEFLWQRDPEDRHDEQVATALEKLWVVRATPHSSLTAAEALVWEIRLALAEQDTELARQRLQRLARLPHTELDQLWWQAQIDLQEGQWPVAWSRWKRLTRQLPADDPRWASCWLHLGRTAELLGLPPWLEQVEAPVSAAYPANADDSWFTQAQIAYQVIRDRWNDTPEGEAATIYLARLQILQGAHEKALLAYQATLHHWDFEQPHALTRHELRQMVIYAWNTWCRPGTFELAWSLAQAVADLLPEEQAAELLARTRQRWAEAEQEALSQATASLREQRAAQVRRLWRDSSRAYAQLAELRRPAQRAATWWLCAEHAFLGQDYASTLEYLDRFLQAPPEEMLPLAHLRRGQVLLLLDRMEDAVGQLQQVLETASSSPSAFAASFWLGICYRELGREDDAERAWLTVIMHPALSPSALEWRDALLALARLRADRAWQSYRQLITHSPAASQREQLWQQTMEWAKLAITHFEEYLLRYPTSEEKYQAAYYLIRCLTLLAEGYGHQAELAETDNGRQQAILQQRTWLSRGYQLAEELKQELTALQQADRLNSAQLALLKHLWFFLPQMALLRQHYEIALIQGSAATNYNPTDMRVLLAYITMAEAYLLTQRRLEARSMLEQAQLILDQQQLPPSAFQSPVTNLSQAEWQDWLSRMRTMLR